MADCPKCGELLLNPKSCGGCGWRSRLRQESSEYAPLEHIPCAHATCNLSARVRILTATGWARLCEPHYVMHFDALARVSFTEKGLDRWPNESREVWRKRVMAYLRAHARPKTFDDAVRAEDEWATA